jgi:hypothetical protein
MMRDDGRLRQAWTGVVIGGQAAGSGWNRFAVALERRNGMPAFAGSPGNVLHASTHADA